MQVVVVVVSRIVAFPLEAREEVVMVAMVEPRQILRDLRLRRAFLKQAAVVEAAAIGNMAVAEPVEVALLSYVIEFE